MPFLLMAVSQGEERKSNKSGGHRRILGVGVDVSGSGQVTGPIDQGKPKFGYSASVFSLVGTSMAHGLMGGHSDNDLTASLSHAPHSHFTSRVHCRLLSARLWLRATQKETTTAAIGDAISVSRSVDAEEGRDNPPWTMTNVFKADRLDNRFAAVVLGR